MNKMDRRTFLGGATAAAVGAALAPSTLLTGCAGAPIRKEGPSMDAILEDGPRVMWCGAHPDDEILVGSIIAKSSLVLKNPLYLLVMNHGDGGDCCREEGCEPDVPTVRGLEMKQVAELYRAELQHEYYYNAPLPVESFPERHEIAQMWKDHKDPTLVCAEAIRRFRPNLLLTFHPDWGATGHPEHQLSSRFVTAGVRMAADDSRSIGDLQAHRVEYMYYGVNRYWPFLMIGKGDPGPITEIWDATQPCINGMDCREVMAEFTRPHRSQHNDMNPVRKLRGLFGKNYLYRVDPFTEIKDPYEPVGA